MTRLIVVAEGQSEAAFITQILGPHLEEDRPGLMSVSASVLRGHCTFARLKKDLLACLAASDSVAVTTMIDLYKIAPDIPGLWGKRRMMRPHTNAFSILKNVYPKRSPTTGFIPIYSSTSSKHCC